MLEIVLTFVGGILSGASSIIGLLHWVMKPQLPTESEVAQRAERRRFYQAFYGSHSIRS